VIDVPEKLTKDQEAAVETLAATMNGDPRSRLFTTSGARTQGAGDGGA